MVYIDGTRAVGGGLGRYIQLIIKNTVIYDYIIGDVHELDSFYPREKILSKKYFEEKVVPTLTEKDIIHFPANEMEIDIKESECKVVLTIHDTIPLSVKSFSQKEKNKWNEGVEKASKRADYILTVSNNSKNDIEKYYPWTKGKIIVIYNAISKDINRVFVEDDLKDIFKYKFFLGKSRLKHKNFWRCLIAFRVSKVYKDSVLYITLEDSYKWNLFFGLLGMKKHICLLGPITDQKMSEVFSTINAILFVSLYEGFGLPPLEAMACGSIAICSDIEVFRELYKDIPIYVNPCKIKDIADGISLATLDNHENEIRKSKGMNLKEIYSEELMAKGLTSFFEKISGSV